MKESFKNLYQKLTESPYEAHWFKTIPPNEVVNGVLSDCSDRAYCLADYCETNNIPYQFVLSLFTTPSLSLHIAILIEGMVYDPIFQYYEIPLTEYKKVLGAKYYLQVGKWIRRIIP